MEEFLKKELKKTKHIMTWGTMGSLNIDKDIDKIITKKPNSPSADFFREIHDIFDNLDSYIWKNFKTRVVRFAHSTQEHLFEYKIKSKKVLFHTMIYVSFPQIEKDWDWAIFKEENVTEILTKNYSCIHGNLKDIFSKEFQKENYYDSIFTYLYLYDVINSNLSKKLFLKIMNECFEYLYKKRLKIKNPVAKNKEEAKKYFYELCDIIDKLNKK